MLKIVCVGKLKEKFYSDACSEYLKRLSKYTKINIIELDDFGTDNISVALLKESELIKKKIDSKDYIITLEIDGKQLSSVDFSKKIEQITIDHPNIVFIIGGSYGLHDDIKKLSNYRLSISKMTFPHQLFRVILLEQIYRAYKIINNEKYHK